jgi:hypothetical protein
MEGFVDIMVDLVLCIYWGGGERGMKLENGWGKVLKCGGYKVFLGGIVGWGRGRMYGWGGVQNRN